MKDYQNHRMKTPNNWSRNSGDLPNATDIDVAYRLGKAVDKGTRSILVSFNNQAIKDNILKRANKIKQSSGYTALWINRDLPEITRRQTANTRRCYNLLDNGWLG